MNTRLMVTPFNCKSGLSALVMLLGSMFISPQVQANISTIDIMASAVCPDCIDYKVVGMCLWMTCTPFGCHTDTSIKVKHRLPDMVALSYRNTGEGPWAATSWMAPANGLASGGGNANERSPSLTDSATVTFQNVDIIGHPAEGTFFEMLSSFGYVLKGPAKPFVPYYLSSLDTLGWRFNIPDMINPNSWNPFDKLGNWGNIYPRGGFQIQKHPYKSAALAAFKATHIVTRKNQGRLYQSLVAEPRQGYWPPKPVALDNNDTAWQPLYPKMEKKAAIWPDINDGTAMNDPYAERISEDNSYAWTVWRTYIGCEQKGSTLIAHVGE